MIEPPPEFSRSISEFLNFMTACTLVLTLYPNTYSSNEHKVLYVVSCLYGTAISWAHNIAENFDHQYRHRIQDRPQQPILRLQSLSKD